VEKLPGYVRSTPVIEGLIKKARKRLTSRRHSVCCMQTRGHRSDDRSIERHDRRPQCVMKTRGGTDDCLRPNGADDRTTISDVRTARGSTTSIRARMAWSHGSACAVEARTRGRAATADSPMKIRATKASNFTVAARVRRARCTAGETVRGDPIPIRAKVFGNGGLLPRATSAAMNESGKTSVSV